MSSTATVTLVDRQRTPAGTADYKRTATPSSSQQVFKSNLPTPVMSHTASNQWSSGGNVYMSESQSNTTAMASGRPMVGTTGSAMSTSRYSTLNQRNGGAYHATQSSMTQASLGRWSENSIARHSDELRVISERVVEHEVRVPKKVLREDIVERVIVVPEKVMHEEVVEDVSIVREKIVEVARPIIQERIVEVPEIEFVEKVVEVPQIVYQEKIREIPRVEFQERIIEVPKIITQERVVEVPEIEYQEVPYEKIVEIPEIHEQLVLKQIPVPQYVDKPVPEYVDVEVETEVTRHVPVPVEAITTIDLQVPQLRPRYTKVDVPLYVPRFVEVAMPAEMMDASSVAQAQHYAQQVALVAEQTAASLCEVERLGGALKELDGHYAQLMAGGPRGDVADFVSQTWGAGNFSIANDIHSIPVVRPEILARQESSTRNKSSFLPKEAVSKSDEEEVQPAVQSAVERIADVVDALNGQEASARLESANAPLGGFEISINNAASITEESLKPGDSLIMRSQSEEDGDDKHHENLDEETNENFSPPLILTGSGEEWQERRDGIDDADSE